jgi:PAS domain S-box-containing protein
MGRVLGRTASAIRVLHVDDEPNFAETTAAFLEQKHEQFDIETVTSPSDGFQRLEESTFDCIVSDHDMPGQNGIEFLEGIREEYPDLPFILYTGKGSEEIASDAISAGVTDYLQKKGGTSQYTVLANRIRNAVDNYRARTELAEREQRLNLFFEQSPLGVVEWDENFDFVRVNDAAEEILGYTEVELVGNSWEMIVPESDRDPVDDVVSDLLENAGGYQSINENVRKDGDRIVCEWHNRVVTDDEEDVVAIFSQFQDVTEADERKFELQQMNTLLSTLVETFPFGVLAEDADRNVLAVNERLLELFGMPGAPEDVVGANCERMAEEVSELFTHPAAFVDRIDAVIAQREPVYDERLTLQDGRTFTRTHEPIELPTGDGHLWVYRDITAQAEREERLEALNRTTQELVSARSRAEVADIGVEAARDILDLEANAIHLHDEDQSGLAPVSQTDISNALVGEPPTFVPGNSIAWRVYESGEPLALDDVHDDPDIHNPESPVRSELYLPIDDHGILISASETPEAFGRRDIVLGELLAGNIATALDQIDQTEELRTREQNLERQNERLEEFTSVVSHDLRNPLQVAEGQVELARTDCESEHIDAIERALDRMDALIEDLLELAAGRERVDATEVVDFADLCTECWQNVETADATHEVTIERSVRAERSRLAQLIENLSRNAIDHGGRNVTVTVGPLEDGFYVEDDGAGVPESERDDVFDAGYSTAEDGTGFGLSIVEQVATAHGWDTRVTDGRDGGARFEIRGVEFVD